MPGLGGGRCTARAELAEAAPAPGPAARAAAPARRRSPPARSRRSAPRSARAAARARGRARRATPADPGSGRSGATIVPRPDSRVTASLARPEGTLSVTRGRTVLARGVVGRDDVAAEVACDRERPLRRRRERVRVLDADRERRAVALCAAARGRGRLRLRGCGGILRAGPTNVVAGRRAPVLRSAVASRRLPRFATGAGDGR